MSMFKVTVGVGNPAGGDLAPVDAIVDTGAAHTMLPASLLERLNIRPMEQLGFILADGSRVKYGFGIARLGIADYGERPCAVIFGPEDNYLLGASALEMFNLLVDPHGKRLAPAEWLRLGWGGPLE